MTLLVTFLRLIITVPIRLVVGSFGRAASTAVGSFRLGYRTGRLVGYGRLLLVALGVGIGVLVAPGPGAELRSRLVRFVRQRQGAGERGPLAPPSAQPGERPSPATPGVVAAPTAGPQAATGASAGEDVPDDVRPPTGPAAAEGATGVPAPVYDDDDDTGELPTTFE